MELQEQLTVGALAGVQLQQLLICSGQWVPAPSKRLAGRGAAPPALPAQQRERGTRAFQSRRRSRSFCTPAVVAGARLQG